MIIHNLTKFHQNRMLCSPLIVFTDKVTDRQTKVITIPHHKICEGVITTSFIQWEKPRNYINEQRKRKRIALAIYHFYLFPCYSTFSLPFLTLWQALVRIRHAGSLDCLVNIYSWIWQKDQTAISEVSILLIPARAGFSVQTRRGRKKFPVSYDSRHFPFTRVLILSAYLDDLG